MVERNPGAGAFERLNQSAAALLDPLVDARLAEQPVLQARRLGEALMLCAQAAERAGVRGFSHLATLAVPHLQTLAGQGAWLPCRDAVEAWIGALIAFCAGHLPASEAGSLMAALRDLPGFPAVPPQFVTLIERRLASDAERIAGLAAAGADAGLAGAGPADARRPAPAMPEAPVPVARDELDMLAQALQALADESAALLSAMPLSTHGAAEGARREWLDLVGERLRHWINATGYIGLAPLADLVGLAVQSVIRWADQAGPVGSAADAAQRDRIVWLPGALGDFLLSMAEDRARALCRGLADPRWPVALADDQIAAAVAAITCWRLVPSRQVQAREAPITEDDLSLRVPADADPQVVDNLLRELPGLSAALADAIQAMADDPAPALADAQRAAHTLKGSANTVGIRGIATLAHQLEDLLALHARGGGGPAGDALALLEEGVDTLAEMCEAVAGQGPAPAAAFAVAGRLAAAVAELAGGDAPEDSPAPASGADHASERACGAADGAAEPEAAQPAPDAPPERPASARSLAGSASDRRDLPAPLPDSDASAAPPEEARDEPLRVRAAELDRMLELASQAAMLLAQSQEELARLQDTRAALRAESERLQDLAIELERVVDLRSLVVDRDAGQAGFDALELDRYDDLHTVSRRIAEAGADSRLIDRQLDHHVAALGDAIGQLERVQTDLSETVMQSRMVPVATIVPRLQRAVRQAARMGSRRVRLEIAGDATAVDAQLLQSLVDPLVHLLRNAVSHGIEDPDERARAGKPELGTVRLGFAHTGRALAVTCLDDGRGLDEDRIVAQARARGLIAADAPRPDAARIARLVLAPGFSTREAATQLAGRGIGLDVVQRAVAALRGQLSLASEPGRGLTVSVSLPVSMAGLPVLVARTATHVLALSVRQVEHILPGLPTRTEADGRPVVDTPQGPVPVRRLDALLGLPAGWLSRADPAQSAPADAPPPAEAVLVVRGQDGEAVALIGPALAQTRRVVLRPLPSWLPRLPGVEGACVLGDGSAAAVIDLPQLLAAGGLQAVAGALTAPALPEAPRAPLCLVVDDSVSVRRATEAFVQDLGLRALGAGDGLEALARARAEAPALAIVDLEMPRMNGVELVRALRADAGLRGVPVIMITSRASEKHRRLALEVGVDAFLTKPYTEDELAAEIRACLERHPALG